jgi:hypothetical protein
MNRLLAIVFFGAVMTATNVAQLADQASLYSRWSEEVRGIRMRLCFVEAGKVNNTRTSILYLEVQNLSRSVPVTLFYSAGSAPFQGELRDSSGKVIPPGPCAYSGPMPVPTWLIMPEDSVLRFPVSLPGFGVSQVPGLFVPAQAHTWLIPNGTAETELSGTVTIPAPVAELPKSPANPEQRPTVWHGTIRVPPLRIPAIR